MDVHFREAPFARNAPALLALAAGSAAQDTTPTNVILLMADDLGKIPWLVNHSRRTLAVIRSNDSKKGKKWFVQ